MISWEKREYGLVIYLDKMTQEISLSASYDIISDNIFIYIYYVILGGKIQYCIGGCNINILHYSFQNYIQKYPNDRVCDMGTPDVLNE